MMPGEIGQMYQPVPPQDQYYVVPREQEAEYLRKKIPVKIMWRMGEKTIEKEYLVPEAKAHTIVNVAAAYNVTKERMSVKLTGLKRLYTRAVVKLTNFRRIK